MRLNVDGFRVLRGLAVVLAMSPQIARCDAVVQYHCAGATALAADTNLNGIFALHSTSDLREILLDRCSGLVSKGLNLPGNTPAGKWFAPLLGDFLARESMGSFGQGAGGGSDFIVAIQSDGQTSQAWQGKFAKAFGNAGEPFAPEGFEGRRWTKNGANLFWMIAAQGWIVAGRGDAFLSLQHDYLHRIKQQGRPATALSANWLEAEVDYARASAWWPDWSRFLRKARVEIRVAAEKDKLRTRARVVYPEAIAWKSEPWRIPTEMIHNPVVSFSAWQDMAAFMDLGSAYTTLDGNPFTNQFYGWAMSRMPLQTYMAWPVTNAGVVLEKLAAEAAASFNSDLKSFNRSKLQWQADKQTLQLGNLRVLSPSLAPVKEKSGEYLIFSIFPMMRGDVASASSLTQDVEGRTNLVYRDWENTGHRLQQWRFLGNVLLCRLGIATDDMVEARSVEDKWMSQLTTLAGESTTEVTRVSPQELAVERDSPYGFTGIETFLLCNWLGNLPSPPEEARLSGH